RTTMDPQLFDDVAKALATPTSRRDARALLAGLAGASGLSALPIPGLDRGALAALTQQVHEGNATRALPQPKVLKSAHGELAVTLTAMPGVVHMGAPRPVKTYTYDNVVPGYTWEVNPGDTLTVDLVNHLPALPHPPAMEMTRPHEWTWTNLHTHGLHVSPAGIADNIFLEIAPGETQRYEIPLPAHHPGG